MLTKKSLVLASTIAAQLDEKGLELQAKETSPLERLMLGLVTPSELTSLESYTQIANYIHRESLSLEEDGVTPYDSVMDEIVFSLAPMLKRYLKLLKSVVTPFIKEVAEDVRTKLDDYMSSSETTVTVKEISLPELLSDTDFMSMVEQVKDSVFNIGTLPNMPRLPDLDLPQIRELLATYGNLTPLVNEVVSNCNGLESTVYDKLFRRTNPLQSTLAGFLTQGKEAVYYAILAFLMANTLIKTDPPSGTIGTLEEYERYMALIRGQAALAIFNHVENLRRKTRLGIMVISCSGNQVTVNPGLYREWVNKGGDVNALYGLAVSNKGYTALADIDANKDYLVDHWSSFRKQATDTKSENYLNKAKFFLLDSFVTQLEKFDELTSVGVPTTEAIQNFKKLLAFVTTQDLMDLPSVVMKLVCKSKLKELDAEVFYTDLETAMSKDKSLTVKEAALIATINYLARWIAKDIIVKVKHVD